MAGQTIADYHGRIMIGLCGYYDVLLDTGELVQTVAQGKFRKSRMKPAAGDLVTVRKTEEEQGVFGSITEIEERKNVFIRPPVANIDKTAVVISSGVPAADMLLVDKLLVQCIRSGVKPFLVLTKCDSGKTDVVESLIRDYHAFDVIMTSSRTGEGIERFREQIGQGICALAGQSGVGKSTLLNTAFPGLNLETGNLSRKVERGRHTTRASQLLDLGNGCFVVDTPGFSLMDMENMEPESLKEYYPEFKGLDDLCRFGSKCMHAGEPGCACEEDAESGRMIRYRQLLGELREKWKRRYE